MASTFNDELVFAKDVTFSGNCTFSETPAEISLDNLVNLGGTGAATFADLVATDDLTVGDDATITGDLAVGGASALHATAITGALSVSTTSTLTGDVACGAALAVTGATTLAAASSTTLTASTSLVVTGASVVGLHEFLSVDVADLSASAVYGIPCPVAGTVTKIWSRLKAPLSTGDATLTGKIGSTGITNGVITIAESGSAIGDVDSATPSAANTVAVGDSLSVTVGGANASAVGATVVFQIRRSA